MLDQMVLIQHSQSLPVLVAVVEVSLIQSLLGAVVVLAVVAAMEAWAALEYRAKVMLAALAHRVTQQILLLAVVVVLALLD
jgi:hypothetical protein